LELVIAALAERRNSANDFILSRAFWMPIHG